MKYAYLLVVGLLAVAATSQARSIQVEDDTYIKEHIKGLWELIKGKASVHIDELKRQSAIITEQLRNAHGEAKKHLQEKLDEIKTDMTKSYQDFIDKMKDIFNKKESTDDTYFNEAIWAKLGALKNLITEKGGKLKDIIAELGKATSDKAKTHLQAQKEIILNELSKLRDELLRKIREAMIPDEDTYVVDEALEQMLRNLKDQLKGMMGQIGDIKNWLTEAGQAKIAAARVKAMELVQKIKELISRRNTESDTYAMNDSDYIIKGLIEQLKGQISGLKEQINVQKELIKKSAGEHKAKALEHLKELQGQLGGMWTELKAALRDIFSKNQTYAVQEDDYIINTIKEIRAALNEKLGHLKELADAAKIGAGLAKEEALKAMQALKAEIGALKNELMQKIKDMFRKDEQKF